MLNFGRFGPLIGVVSIFPTKTKFQIFATKNAEILTCHEQPLYVLSPREGWSEYDPSVLWKTVAECIHICVQNLLLLDIEIKDIVSISVVNQGDTCVLWNPETGEVLHNAISAKDTRAMETASKLEAKIRNKSEYLKEICGSTISYSSSAVKVAWICDNNERVRNAISEGKCFFGTLDTWIIWNLTGGIDSGVHVTDVTNASRTMLFNLKSRSWDQSLCDFFRINSAILPSKIQSCSEIYGFIHDGKLALLQGIPIAGCISERSATLLGQMCLKREQMTICFNEDSHMIVNTGQEVICSDHGLVGTVAFQLGPDEPTFYALEGSVFNAGSSISWLSNVLNFSQPQATATANHPTHNSYQNSQSESVYFSISPQATTCTTPPDLIMSEDTIPNNADFRAGFQKITSGSGKNGSKIMFIPPQTYKAPNHTFQNGGLMSGLTTDASALDILQSALEGICFQMRTLLEGQEKDCKTWNKIKSVIIGGDLIESHPSLCQLVADVCDVSLEFPQITSPSALGAMVAAGLTMKLFTLDQIKTTVLPQSEVYQSSSRVAQLDLKYKQWQAFNDAVKRLKATDSVTRQPKDRLFYVHRSIPGTIFLTTAFVLMLVADLLNKA